MPLKLGGRNIAFCWTVGIANTGAAWKHFFVRYTGRRGVFLEKLKKGTGKEQKSIRGRHRGRNGNS